MHLRIVSCMLLALLAACGSGNSIRLLPPPCITVIPSSGVPRVTVVAFEDRRADQAVIGVRRDRSAFVTDDDVSQWVSSALADELARNGMQVSYTITGVEARKGNPDFIVTGQVGEAGIHETSPTNMTTSLRAGYTLVGRHAPLLHESFSASKSHAGMLWGDAAEKLMLETLRKLVKPMARSIVRAMKAGGFQDMPASVRECFPGPAASGSSPTF